jgi:hypothetical protein
LVTDRLTVQFAFIRARRYWGRPKTFLGQKEETPMLKSLIAAAVLVSALAFTAAPASADRYHHHHHHDHQHHHHHHNHY